MRLVLHLETEDAAEAARVLRALASIEHGRDEPADIPETAVAPGAAHTTAERGNAEQQANLPPENSTEGIETIPHRRGLEGRPRHVMSAEEEAAWLAEQQAPAPPDPYLCRECGLNRTSKKNGRCRECGGRSYWTTERRAAQGDRARNKTTIFTPALQPDVDKTMDTPPEPSDTTPAVDQREPGDNPATPLHEEETPARGLAAVTANPPVAAPSTPVCSCLPLWREHTQGFHEYRSNEGHNEACALYRKGGHRWPLPSAQGASKGPFTVQCGWCLEKRDVDAHGVEWRLSELNPDVVVRSPYSKNAKAPANA